MNENLRRTVAPGYMKCEKTGVVVNVNEAEYRSHLAARKQSSEIRRLSEELNNIKKALGI